MRRLFVLVASLSLLAATASAAPSGIAADGDAAFTDPTRTHGEFGVHYSLLGGVGVSLGIWRIGGSPLFLRGTGSTYLLSTMLQGQLGVLLGRSQSLQHFLALDAGQITISGIFTLSTGSYHFTYGGLEYGLLFDSGIWLSGGLILGQTTASRDSAFLGILPADPDPSLVPLPTFHIGWSYFF